MSEEKANHNTQTDPIRNRSIRLFTYIRELVKLRSKAIRTLDSYESVLWFSDIPREQGCFTQAWGAAEEGREEFWLEIKKPKNPLIPSVPNILHSWVREADLRDSSKVEPELLERILVKKEKAYSKVSENTPYSSAPQFLNLNNHPCFSYLLELWADYLEEKWKPWAEEYRRSKSVQEVYAKLFSIYQKQKSLGEEFEIVIGFGLLNCQNPKVQPISLEGINIEQLRIDARTVNLDKVKPPQPFDSWFEVDVFLRIIARGYRVIPQFEVAGYFIDLVVEGMQGRLAVECDGDEHHGPEQYEYDMNRQRILERCGWTFWRILGSKFYLSPDQAMTSLWELLNSLRIAPGGQDIEPHDNEIKKTDCANNVTRQEVAEEQGEEIHGEPANANTTKTPFSQGNLFDSQNKSAERASPSERLDAIFEKLPYASRSEMLDAILTVLPSQEIMLRSEAIRAAARLLRDKGRIEFQRVRESGYIWNEFKSAISSGIRRGLLSGDTKTIWRRTSNGAFQQ